MSNASSNVGNPVSVDAESASAVADLLSLARSLSVSSVCSASKDVAIESSSAGNVTLSQVKDLFSSLSKSLEACFAMINNGISQAMSSASDIDNRNVSQDVVTGPSFSASPIVAGRTEPTPERTSFALYS